MGLSGLSNEAPCLDKTHLLLPVRLHDGPVSVPKFAHEVSRVVRLRSGRDQRRHSSLVYLHAAVGRIFGGQNWKFSDPPLRSDGPRRIFCTFAPAHSGIQGPMLQNFLHLIDGVVATETKARSFFKKMGQPRPLFNLFSPFQTHISNFTTNR